MFNVRIEGPLHVVYDDATGVTIKECATAREAAIFVGTEKAGNVGNLAQHLLKKYGDAHLFTDCMGDETTGEYDHDTRAAVCARVHHEATGKWPTEKEMKEARDMAETKKEQSLNEFQDKVYRAFNAQFSGSVSGIQTASASSSWVVETYPDHVIASEGDDFYSVPMTIDANGNATFANRSEWTKVKQIKAWVEKAARLRAETKASDSPSDYLVVEDRDKPTTWHLQVRKNGKPDHGLMGSAWAALTDPSGFRGNKYEGPNKQEAVSKLRKIYESEDMPIPGEDKKEHDPSWLAKFAAIFTPKEGRRNATSDQDHLDQAHDHLVQAGAKCPMMVMKQADGKSRWVLISTNAYEDRDGEYVSRKAQKRDVERMTETKQYGPLRLWHLGYPDVEKKEAGPGVDIGDCDYSQMFGKFRVESGTFRNERIAAAIKERADRWATSVGFFHPQNEPDPSGTYHEIYTFERSLLPRTKASNLLTPLAAIIKELAMTTKEEKAKQLAALLGDDKLAQDVLSQVDSMEKEAQKRGLTFKDANVTEKTSAKKMPMMDGDEPDEDDLSDMDEATQKAYNTMLPHIVKAIHNLTKKDNIEGKKERKAAKKERKAVDARLDQITQALAELKGELPRGLARSGYQPSQSKENLITLAGVPTLKENMPDPLGDFMKNIMNFDPKTMSGTNPTTGQ